MDFDLLVGITVIYIVAWIGIYVFKGQTMRRYAGFTTLLFTVFYIVSLLLHGLCTGFRELWLTSFSWAIVANYLLSEYNKRYFPGLFLKEWLARFEEILESPETTEEEKTIANYSLWLIWITVMKMMSEWD